MWRVARKASILLPALCCVGIISREVSAATITSDIFYTVYPLETSIKSGPNTTILLNTAASAIGLPIGAGEFNETANVGDAIIVTTTVNTSAFSTGSPQREAGTDRSVFRFRVLEPNKNITYRLFGTYWSSIAIDKEQDSDGNEHLLAEGAGFNEIEIRTKDFRRDFSLSSAEPGKFSQTESAPFFVETGRITKDGKYGYEFFLDSYVSSEAIANSYYSDDLSVRTDASATLQYRFQITDITPVPVPAALPLLLGSLLSLLFFRRWQWSNKK